MLYTIARQIAETVVTWMIASSFMIEVVGELIERAACWYVP